MKIHVQMHSTYAVDHAQPDYMGLYRHTGKIDQNFGLNALNHFCVLAGNASDLALLLQAVFQHNTALAGRPSLRQWFDARVGWHTTQSWHVRHSISGF